MNKKLFVFPFIMMMMLLTPVIANAHVKWFTELTPPKESIEHILSPLFLSITLAVAVLLAVLSQIIHVMDNWHYVNVVDRKLDSFRKYSPSLLRYGTAAALMIQTLSGTLLAPEFEIDSTLQIVLAWLTIVLLLVPNRYTTKAAALLLCALFIYQTTESGWFHMLDYGFYIAIAAALFVTGSKLKDWGFPFLYLGTGLSLCWVAVEKWVFPAMSVDIIHHHGVPTFGFSPEVFIVLSAFIEFVVGYLLIVGILNRLLAVVLTCIFILTTTLFGGVEFNGHFIIHIILIIFIIEGVSFYKPPIKMHKSRLDQMIFIFLNFLFVLATYVLIYYRFA